MKTSAITTAIAVIVGAFLAASTAGAQTTSFNTGSLGSAGDGTYVGGVTAGLSGPLTATGDFAVGYSGGSRTTVPFTPALNPAASASFTIEFWANPSASDNDDAPLANRIATGDRSGWVFFQRAAGWNFRMYNGVGSGLGWDLTGGTSTLNAWSHVVAVWNGTGATLYVNGVLADNTNDPAATGVYNVTTTAIFSTGALFDGGSATTSLVDEVAFYGSALSPVQIANHFALAASPTPGAYSSAVFNDGAIEYLQNIPEPSAVALLGFGLAGVLQRRRRSCH